MKCDVDVEICPIMSVCLAQLFIPHLVTCVDAKNKGITKESINALVHKPACKTQYDMTLGSNGPYLFYIMDVIVFRKYFLMLAASTAQSQHVFTGFVFNAKINSQSDIFKILYCEALIAIPIPFDIERSYKFIFVLYFIESINDFFFNFSEF